MKRSISFRPTLLALVLATTFPVAHAAVPKDMLVIGKAADPQTLDPAVTIDNNDWTVTYPSYQRLVQYKTDGDKGSTDVEGDLASSWKASDDQKEWTFTLKDNAKFADGTPVDSKAVKFSVERVMAVKKGPADYFKPVTAIETPDAETVVFKLKYPKGSPEEKKFLNAANKLSSISVVHNFEAFRETSKKNDFDYFFYMEFESMKAYDEYNEHPVHTEFVETYWKKYVEKFLEIDYEPIK